MPGVAVSQMQNALHRALDVKLYSLGIACPENDLFSKIERLVKAGIDVRSTAWRDLVAMRGYDAHARQLSTLDLDRLRHQVSGLRKVLYTLQPTFGPM
jgi:hypothetical protein